MPHRDDLAGAEHGADGHLDEGTIHAWLDAALPADEAAAAERHVARCARCSAAVAEARGLIAGASRILSALDGGLGAVSAVPRPTSEAAAPLPPRREVPAARGRWSVPAWGRAAAAVLVLAAGSAVVIDRAGDDRVAAVSGVQQYDSMATFASSIDSAASPHPGTAAPLAAPAPAVGMREEAAAGAGRTAAPRSRPMGAAASVRMSPPSARELVEQVAAAPPSAPVPTAVLARPMPAAPGVAAGTASSVSADPALAPVLTGVVRDAGSQRPIEGVQVLLSRLQRSAVTDSAGRFSIANVPAGSHVAVVRRIGYQALERTVAVTAGGPGEMSLVMQPATAQLSTQRIVTEALSLAGRDSANVAGRARVAAAATAAPDVVRRDSLRAGDRAERAERLRAAPPAAAAQGLRVGGAIGGVADVAGCYRVAPEGEADGRGAAAPALPAFVVLDTAGTPAARRLQLRYSTPPAGARPGGWRVGTGGAGAADGAAMPVTLWWRDDRADWSMTLLRVGSVLSGAAVGTPTVEPPAVPSRARVRLTPTACGLLPPR